MGGADAFGGRRSSQRLEKRAHEGCNEVTPSETAAGARPGLSVGDLREAQHTRAHRPLLAHLVLTIPNTARARPALLLVCDPAKVQAKNPGRERGAASHEWPSPLAAADAPLKRECARHLGLGCAPPLRAEVATRGRARTAPLVSEAKGPKAFWVDLVKSLWSLES